MREQQIRKGRVWVLGGIVLAGLVYSVLALTLTATPVYASSCNCSEEFTEAYQFCASHLGILSFGCPLNCSPQGPCWAVICRDNVDFGELCSGT